MCCSTMEAVACARQLIRVFHQPRRHHLTILSKHQSPSITLHARYHSIANAPFSNLFRTLNQPVHSSLSTPSCGLQTAVKRHSSSGPSTKILSSSMGRAASTTAAAASNSASATAPAVTSHVTGSNLSSLNWNNFLLLRRRRRVTGLVFSIFSALTTTATGLSVASTRDLDAAAAAALGLDPIIVLAIGTMSFAGIGWLVGPFLGNLMFAVFARRKGVWQEFIAKDRAFLHRIRTRRVDPSSASIQNPVPDYYGEKIGSVADYRRWLKDQRAFNLKRGDRIASAVVGSAGTVAESAAVSMAKGLSQAKRKAM